MEDNTVINATNEQIELDKDASLSVRTKESLKTEFKAIDGKTDNDKLISLLELHRKFQLTQDKFSIAESIDTINKAFGTITRTLESIQGSVNQHERTMQEQYIVNVADEMKVLKEQIQNEEVLEAKNMKLEKELELLNKRFEEKEMMVSEGKNKIANLDAENKALVTKNSELVTKNSELVQVQNNYINELREKDVEINSKSLEIDKLNGNHKDKIESLEKQNKENLEQMKEASDKKINELEKEKAIVENTVSSLRENIEKYRFDNEKLNIDIEQLRKDSKEEMKQLETTYKEQVDGVVADKKVVEDKSNKLELENARMVSKLENAESNIKALQEERNEFKQELKMYNDDIKKLEKENMKLSNEKEKALSSFDVTVEQLKADKKANDKVVSDKDKEIEKLRAEIEQLKAPKTKAKSKSKENKENE